MLREIVLVHRALALAEQVVNLAHVDVAPDFGPLGIDISAERRAKRVGGGLIIFLVEHRLAHAEVREGIGWLDVERALVFLNRLVILAERRQSLASRDGRANPQARARFQQIVVRVNRDAVGLGAAERIQPELRSGAGDQDLS